MICDDNKKQDEEYLYHLIYLPRGTERLEKLGELKEYPKNIILNEPGEVPTFCYVVKKGQVLCFELSYEGEQRIYNIMEEGSVFMEECLLFDKPCPVTFRTLTTCELVKIDKCDLKRAFKKDIDVVMDICESMSSKFLSSMELIRFGPHNSAEWKLCKMLVIFAQHNGIEHPDGSVEFRKRISQQMLGDLLGMNRVTVARKIKELKDQGLFIVTENNRQIIPSIEELERHMIAMERD